MTRVAIMQPTYLPWCGYFGLIAAVDVFIFLDSVQFAKRSWQQRNQIKTARGGHWLTVPVDSKGRSEQLISEVKIDKKSNFSSKHVKSIEVNYAKAVHFKDFGPDLFELINRPYSHLVDMNVEIIKHCLKVLNINTEVIYSSQMHGVGVKADLLASLCKEVCATEYISAPGSKNYLETSVAFKEIGVPVSYFNYVHPEYPQLFGDFLPYISFIDMLLNCGDRSSDLILSGIKSEV